MIVQGYIAAVLGEAEDAVRVVRVFGEVFEQIVRDVSCERDGDVDDLARVEGREVAEEFHGRGGFEQVGAHYVQLGNDAEDVEVDAEGEEEVPELEDFGKWGGASAERHYAGEGIDFGGEVFGSEVRVEWRVEDL